MSSHSPERPLDPTRLVSTVLDKTKVGKLKWEETADENVFIASVGGKTILKVRHSESNRYGLPCHTLGLLDENGKLFWEIEAPPLIGELFGLARRIALKVDAKVEALLETLQKL